MIRYLHRELMDWSFENVCLQWLIAVITTSVPTELPVYLLLKAVLSTPASALHVSPDATVISVSLSTIETIIFHQIDTNYCAASTTQHFTPLTKACNIVQN